MASADRRAARAGNRLARLAAPATIRRVIGDGVLLARLSRDLPPFLRRPIDPRQAAAILRQRLAGREEQFLFMARSVIFGLPTSPFRRLLAVAGCERGDLETLVHREGVEAALRQLADRGVRVSLSEFKGRREVVRGSTRFWLSPAEFDNPLVRAHFEVRTGGSRGPTTVVKRSLGFVTDQAIEMAPVLEAHGLQRAEHVIWLTAGVTHLLRYQKLGRPVLAWLYPVESMPFAVRAGARYLSMLGRLSGKTIPTPRFADLGEPERLARWFAELLQEGRTISVSTFPSSAVRVSLAAQQLGLDLTGLWFDVGGEPLTAARQQAIESSGARSILCYAFMEAGIVGYSCADPEASDDLHFLSDAYAVIQRPRPIEGFDLAVDGFLFTTLLPSAAKVLLNVESGDYGRIVQRSCGCALGAVGFQTHLTHIRSFEKLTSEGMAFVQTDLLPILDQVLPARFGGSSADYQVVEQESAQGIPRLFLLVDPSVGPLDESLVRQVFLDSLAQDGLERISVAIWERAGTVTVVRKEPISTGAGKVLPFHLLRDGRPLLGEQVPAEA